METLHRSAATPKILCIERPRRVDKSPSLSDTASVLLSKVA